MRAVVQRVRDCSVRVEDRLVGRIDGGLLVYLGVEKDDKDRDLDYIVNKVVGLRIFEDERGKMNLSVRDVEGAVLVVPQFTLCADTRKGKRPSYNYAADPAMGEKFYETAVEKIRLQGCRVETGEFQASMEVDYVNIGPVTILLDSKGRI
ncbi:MAG TPA: D-tyrosyl-tRNA(Tyr) deacylase [Sediminispirochaeta sp.]|nr:D-tyrosyl-tRNA(Tyr) deacylase [Sediminispirochaeta sp.]